MTKRNNKLYPSNFDILERWLNLLRCKINNDEDNWDPRLLKKVLGRSGRSVQFLDLPEGPIHLDAPLLDSLHIDEILGSGTRRSNVYKAIELFYDLISDRMIAQIPQGYVPQLIIYLPDSYEMREAPNNYREIWQRCFAIDRYKASYTPPEIFLRKKMPNEDFHCDGEFCRKPFYASCFKKLRKRCEITYTCYGWPDIEDNVYQRQINIDLKG